MRRAWLIITLRPRVVAALVVDPGHRLVHVDVVGPAVVLDFGVFQSLVQLAGFEVGVGQLPGRRSGLAARCRRQPGRRRPACRLTRPPFPSPFGLVVEAVEVGQLVGKGVVLHRGAGLTQVN